MMSGCTNSLFILADDLTGAADCAMGAARKGLHSIEEMQPRRGLRQQMARTLQKTGLKFDADSSAVKRTGQSDKARRTRPIDMSRSFPQRAETWAADSRCGTPGALLLALSLLN
jgi:hypothetical protein